MSKTWANGSTRRWRHIRRLVLERDQHRCRLQLAGCTTIATHAHLRVRFDGDRHTTPAHPTWRVDYDPPNTDAPRCLP